MNLTKAQINKVCLRELCLSALEKLIRQARPVAPHLAFGIHLGTAIGFKGTTRAMFSTRTVFKTLFYCMGMCQFLIFVFLKVC